MKSVDILLEEAKKQGIKDAEKLIIDAFKIFESAGPRLAAESDDAIGKTAGMILTVAVPAFKPVIEKLADLNKDGVIG